MKKLFVLIVAILFLIPLNIFASEYSKDDIKKIVDEYYQKNKEKESGIIFSYFDKDATLFEKYYGSADIEGNIPMNQEEVLEWGNISKLFVWVSAMQLEEQGKLDLNENIVRYLPQNFTQFLKYKKKITMLDLMNYSSGFEASVLGNKTDSDKYNILLPEYLLRFERKQINEPGKAFSYNDYDATLAAYVIESISEMPFYSYVIKNILSPLQMMNTSINYNNNDNLYVKGRRNVLKNYTTSNKLTDKSYYISYPAKSVVSDIKDMKIFIKALMNKKSGLFKNENTYDKLFLASKTIGDSEYAISYHGLLKFDYETNVIGESSLEDGYSNILLINPEKRDAIVILTNKSKSPSIDYISDKIFKKTKHTNASFKGFVIKIEDHNDGFMKIKNVFNYRYINTSKNNDIRFVNGKNYLYSSKGDYYKLSMIGVIFEYLLVLLFLVSFIYAIFNNITSTIKKLKNNIELNFSDIFDNIIIIIPFILLFLLFIKINSTIVYPVTYIKLLYYLMILDLLVLITKLIYSIMRLINKKSINILSNVMILFSIINILYWNLFMFWNV